MSAYDVKKINKDIVVSVPGSKSITNRALLLAALANGTSTLKGALNSDDSMHFLNCIRELGFVCNQEGNDITIEGNAGRIPNKSAEIYVGSAGTAARFLTAMLAFSDGEYIIKSSEQMAKRPMKDLIISLISLGARFEFLGNEYAFPFKVKGLYYQGSNRTDEKLSMSDEPNPEQYTVTVNIDKSSQYLSALLMTAPMLSKDLVITLEGNRTAKSYVDITMKMMKSFGVNVECINENVYKVVKSEYRAMEYDIEPDMSAACYFYAMAAVNKVSAVVTGVHNDMMQGDKKFLDVLETMGCIVENSPQGIKVAGPEVLKGIDIDMSDFSDQTMTLAAIAPFAKSDVHIRNVGHIRNQESDRLAAIGKALTAMGIETFLEEDGIIIKPGKPQNAEIETFDDHRIAMAFAVTGTVYGNIRILNPQCCEKTFPEFFEVLSEITDVK